MSVLDLVRRVAPPDASKVDPSSLVWVRGRMLRWTSRHPTRSGWYWIRLARDRRRTCIVYIDQQWLGAAARDFAELEFSDRPVQVPIESEAVDGEAAARLRVAAPRAFDRDTTEAEEMRRLE